MKNLKNILTKSLIFLFVLMTLFDSAIVNVFAGDTVFLQSLIDVSTNKYQVTPVADTNKKKKKMEYKTAQINKYVFEICSDQEDVNKCYTGSSSLSDVTKYSISRTGVTGGSLQEFWIATELMATSGGIYVTDKMAQSKSDDMEKVTAGGSNVKLASSFFLKKGGTDSADYLPLSWPSDPELHSATTEEINYATEVATTLSNSLNEIISMINGGKKIDDTARLMAISVALRPNSGDIATFGNYTIRYKWDIGSGTNDKNIGDLTSRIKDKGWKDDKDISSVWDDLPAYDYDGNLLAYVYKSDDPTIGTLSSFVYAMPKGYRETKGGKYSGQLMFSKGGKPYGDLDDVDSRWVNIHMLAQYANTVYKANGTTAGNVADADEGNWIINMIVNWVQGIINGFLSFLGLKSTNELVYNRGLRGSSLFNYGTMSENWWKTVLQYHLIFQALAWFVIVCGFLKTCIDLNLSRMNPNARENAYDSIKRFLVVGFLLVLIIPISQFLMSMNNSIVQLFATQVVGLESDIAPNVKGIAGIIFIFAYAVIRIYINFVYIMRSITIALLLVSAPFFISVGAWSKNGYHNSLTTQWFKELLANIFMQSVHAFSLAFLINLMGNGSGLESFVISYSIIPITEMFRGLVFQGAGSSTVNLGQQAADKGTKMAQSFAKSAGNAALGAGAKLLNKGESASTEGNGGKGGSGSGKGNESGAAAMNNAINSKVAGLKDKIERGEAGMGAKAAVAAMRGLQGAGKLGGAIAGVGLGMMNAELSGNSMGYSDAGAAAGSYVGSAAEGAANKYVAASTRKNNPVSSGEQISAEDSRNGDYAAKKGDPKNKDGSVTKKGVASSKVNRDASDAMDKIDSGNAANLTSTEKTALAMKVAQEGTDSFSKEQLDNMKSAVGFNSIDQARDFLANQGMSVHGGGNGVAYSYSVGNKSNGSVAASKLMDDGNTAVKHSIPTSNGAVASVGADNSVNLTFNDRKDPVTGTTYSGMDNFRAFAERNSGAQSMLSEITRQQTDYASKNDGATLTSGQLSNGINWSIGENDSINFNYGRDYQRINNINRMDVSHDGNYISAITGNRSLSSIYGTGKTTASSPVRPMSTGFDTSNTSPKPQGNNPQQN